MKTILMLVLLGLASCQTPWGRYDSSLYSAVFEPSEESVTMHLQSLETFVNTDAPPPGLCAEYAYFLVLAGRPAEAGTWLDRELEFWPESAKVVEALNALLLDSQSPLSPVGEEVKS